MGKLGKKGEGEENPYDSISLFFLPFLTAFFAFLAVFETVNNEKMTRLILRWENFEKKNRIFRKLIEKSKK